MQNLRLSMRFVLVLVFGLMTFLGDAAWAAKPSISALSPNEVNAGGTRFTLTISGANFTTGAAANWNATKLTTTFVSASKLTALVPASLIAKQGSVDITVTTAAGASLPAKFTVLPPKPVITSLKPVSAHAGFPSFTLTVNGKSFEKGVVVDWTESGKKTALATAFKSSTLVTASVPAKLIAHQGTASITVVTAGGTSAAVQYAIGAAIPGITELAPASADAGSPGFTLTVKGFNFISGAQAHWNGKALTTKFVSATELTASVLASDIAAKGTASITVTTSRGVSAPAIFTILPPKPTITSLSPNSITAGAAGFTLTVNGTNFVPGATVNWNGAPLKTAYKSPTQLTASVPASDVQNAGTAKVTVTTPSGTSIPATFAINAPQASITDFFPDSITAGEGSFTLTVDGTGFVAGAAVFWNTTKLATTRVSSVQLNATVPANLIANPGTAKISVTTSAGSASSSMNFDINSPTGPLCANDGSGNSELNGVYSFQFTQTDPTKDGQSSQDVGAFTADGNGNISAGLSDSNGAHFTAAQQSAFTGTYSVGSDGRGLLTINYTGGATVNLCFALDSFSSGVAGGGRLVSDQTVRQIDSGAFYAQGSSTIGADTVKGSWAFGMQGIKLDSSNGDEVRGANAGYVALDGSSSVTTGEMDISQDKYSSGNLANAYQSQVGLGGSYTLDSTGRGTLTLNLSGGGTNHYVFYVAGTNRILLLSTDTGGQGGSAVVAGTGYLRPTSISFSNSTLSGTSILVDQALSDTNSTGYNNRLVQAGIFSWTSPGKYSESYDQNDAGDVALEQTASSTYAVDASGRVTISGTSPARFAYLAGSNQGFAVQGNLGVSFLYFEGQSAGGFNASSFDGSYSEGSLWYGFVEQKATSGEFVANGAGILTGNQDVAPILGGVVDSAPRIPRPASRFSRRPAPLDVGIGESYTAAASGRFLIFDGSSAVEALYLVSPEKAYAIDISGAIWQPIELFTKH